MQPREEIQLILGTNNHPMSVMIRTETKSTYSHVAVVDGNEVIEASPIKGVVKTPIKLFLRMYPVNKTIRVQGEVGKARERIGRAYDFEGLLALGLNIDKYDNVQRPDKDFCSEGPAYAMGLPNGHRMLPDDFLAYAIY